MPVEAQGLAASRPQRERSDNRLRSLSRTGLWPMRTSAMRSFAAIPSATRTSLTVYDVGPPGLTSLSIAGSCRRREDLGDDFALGLLLYPDGTRLTATDLER